MDADRITVSFTRRELLELDLIKCSNCTKATGGLYSHPPNNHFESGKGSCAQCTCKKFKMKIGRGKLVLAKKKKPSKDPDIIYAAENADMVSIIRRQVEELGDPYTSIPFLDDCVMQLIWDREEARKVLVQVKIDCLSKKSNLPIKTQAMIDQVLVKK